MIGLFLLLIKDSLEVYTFRCGEAILRVFFSDSPHCVVTLVTPRYPKKLSYMRSILHIDSSARSSKPETAARGSHTRRLSARFSEQWCTLRPQDSVIYRDVAQTPPSPVSAEWVASAFTHPERRDPAMAANLAESDELVNELLTADVVVVGAPMYNFGIPSTLKAWIDNIIRVGVTFGFDRSRGATPYWPMLPPGKQLVILTSRGDYGYGPQEPLESMNHADPALVTAFSYIGITDVRIISVEYDEFNDSRVEDSLDAALSEVSALVESMAFSLGPSGAERSHYSR